MQADKEDHPAEEVFSPREEILYNSLEIILNKDSFYDDEEVEGHILISIKDPFSPQRLTLSVVGEIVSQTLVGGFRKQKTMLQKMSTMIQNPANPTISRTFTAKKELPEQEAPFKKTLTRGFTRTFTMSTNAKTTQGSRGKIMPVEELKNKELFCHYTVPIFVFKTDTLPAGVYKIPFKFALGSAVIPSFNYNRDSFQYTIGYMAIAELEERNENDYGSGFFAGNNNLKCKREVKINKASTRVQAPLMVSSVANLNTEVVGRLKVSELMCVGRPNDGKIRLRLEKSSFRMGDQVNFEIISYEKILKDKKTKITVNLVEELNKFGEQLQSYKNEMRVYSLKFDHDLDKAAAKKTIITGNVGISEFNKEGLQVSSEHIEHFFEVIIGYKLGLLRKYISLRIPITLKGARTAGEPESLAGLDGDAKQVEEVKSEENEDDDDVMVLPLAKFKLEERFNILTKAAQMLEENY